MNALANESSWRARWGGRESVSIFNGGDLLDLPYLGALPEVSSSDAGMAGWRDGGMARRVVRNRPPDAMVLRSVFFRVL